MRRKANASIDHQEASSAATRPHPGNKNSELADVIRLEGVRAKGYGVVPKAIMLDADISATAKSIYGYFVVHASNGSNRAFPGRSRIVADLGLSQRTYYKHYNQLLTQGYIYVEQQRPAANSFGHNIYTLIDNPKKFQEQSEDESRQQTYDTISQAGILGLGFGLLPRAVMIDRRLPIKAKALYMYMASFCGSGQTAFPKRDNILYHLNISEPTYQKYMRQLSTLGYVTVKEKRVGGRWAGNDYILETHPNGNQVTNMSELLSAMITSEDTPDPKKCHTEKYHTRKCHTEKQHTQKGPPNNNNEKINNPNNNKPTVNQSINPKMDGWKNGEPSHLFSIEVEIEKVKHQVDYDYLLASGQVRNIQLLDEIVVVMAETLLATDKNIRVAGALMPLSRVQASLRKLDGSDLLEVLESIQSHCGHIKNLRGYITSCLYNASSTRHTRSLVEINRDRNSSKDADPSEIDFTPHFLPNLEDIPDFRETQNGFQKPLT